MVQGRLAISTELSAANTHSIASLRPRGSAGISAVLQLAEMKQDRAALEDRDVAIGQPRHLAEGLVREMLGLPVAKRHALDAIGQAGLFQRPAHAQVAHKAPAHFGNPVEGGQREVGHAVSPCLFTHRRMRGARSDIGEKFFASAQANGPGRLALV